MPNIFSGFKHMSDEEIKLQIALLDTVTFGNAVKETGYRAVGKLIDFANMFTTIVSDSAKIDYQIIGVVDMIDTRIKQLDDKVRYELDKLLRDQLIAKCNELDANSLDENSSDDRISNMVISEASRLYVMEKYMSPANKAQLVHNKYYQAFIMRLHKNIVRESSEQIKVTDMRLQEALNKVTIERKRELYKKIMPKEFSGRGIGRIIRLENGTKYISEIVESLGMNFFDRETVSVYTIYDMVLGVNRLSRVLMAQLIWNSLDAYGARFTIASDLLPSFIPADMRDTRDKEEKEYMIVKAQRAEHVQKIEKCISEMEKLQEESLQEDIKDQNQIDNNVDQNADKYADKYAEKQTELSEYELEYEPIKEKSDNLIAKRAAQLAMVWKAYFYKFTFEDIVFESTVMEFSNSEILKIEEFLKEMHDSNDTEAYGERQDNYEAKCHVNGSKNATIVYMKSNIMEIRR